MVWVATVWSRVSAYLMGDCMLLEMYEKQTVNNHLR